jgi:hypothetical protein
MSKNCGCITPNVVIDPPPTSCKDCLVAKTIRYSCDKGAEPCGDTVTFDLSTINKVDACKGCSVVYSIKKYDTAAFTSVSITANGVVTFVTSDLWEKGKEYEIIYKITCPCSIMSTTAKIYVCKKDLCKNSPKGSTCSKCSGDYILAKKHKIHKSVSSLSKCAGTGTFNLASITETNAQSPVVYSLVSHTAGLTSVSLNGSVATFSKLGQSYTDQKIIWEASVNGLVSQGEVVIEIKNLCSEVTCNTGYTCDECDGICKPTDYDLEILNSVQII